VKKISLLLKNRHFFSNSNENLSISHENMLRKAEKLNIFWGYVKF